MLSIGKLGAGQEHYYLEKVAEGAEDYYSGEGEAQGYWLGDDADYLGLGGKVEGDQLVAMLTGRNPLTGDPLGLKSAPNREPVPGFDLTFSAPKSVSLVWALGGAPVGGQVAEAHHAAVAEALEYLQRNACWARRGKGGREFLPGTGFLGAGYVHRSSRAGDPQLHTHVLIANATYGPDGRWSRLYHPAIYEHARAAGHIYEAHLRYELTQRLGVEWEPVVNGIADIKGFSEQQLAHFSTRRAEILEAAGPGGSARAMQIATLTTRAGKERDLTDATLRETWRAKGEEVGLTPQRIEALLGHERAEEASLTFDQIERSLTAHTSHFERRDVIQAVAVNLREGAEGFEVVELADDFLDSEQVIEIAATPRAAVYTTQRIWELEQRALSVGAELAARSDRAVAGEVIAERAVDLRPSLKPDQREMVGRLLTGGEGLVIVVGEAGTGKSYALGAAASGWAACRTPLQAAAPTWRAANVLRGEGLEATTVASLLNRFEWARLRGNLGLRRGSVLVVDEAGMVDSASLARLIEQVRAAEAKLVLIGDPAQLPEIEAGGLFGALASRTEVVRLDEVIRHRHELDREGAKAIRDGHGAKALAAYVRGQRVTIGPDRDALREQIARDYLSAQERGEDALMIAKRNEDVRALNQKAREALVAQGRLAGEEIEIAGQRFAAGDRVITRINDQRRQIYNRERWEIESLDAGREAVVLAGIDTARRVGVDAGYLRSVRERDGGPALEHGYAATIYQAQGATVDRAFVLADASMTRQEFYVAASRTREETHLYATPEVSFGREEIAPVLASEDLEHIALAAERDGAQIAAHDKAIRERLEGLSTPELESRASAIRSRARKEQRVEAKRERLAEEIEEAGRQFRALDGREAAAHGLRRRERKAEYERIDERAREISEARRLLRNDLLREPDVSHQARAEAAAADYLLAQRHRAEEMAMELAPPRYIARALGPRPRGSEARTWDDGARAIDQYRREHDITDTRSALGPAPKDEQGRYDWEAHVEHVRGVREHLDLQEPRFFEFAHERELDDDLYLGWER